MLTIPLTSELEKVITQYAAKAGTTPELPVLRDLRNLYLPVKASQYDIDPRLAVLLEIRERSESMAPAPDPSDWLREGRQGGIYGV